MSRTVEFIKSAASPEGFIRDQLPLVVFAGRSNVGKSSLINSILGRKSAARVSSTPGKTAHVNYFLIDDRLYFADIPGYGFARVSQEERNRWDGLMAAFFEERDRISLAVLIVDIRHKPTKDDLFMAEMFFSSGIKSIVVANKYDKLKKSEVEPALELIRDTLPLGDDIPLLPFSAKTGFGRAAVEKAIFGGI